jgi:ubiquinone/menaquinone biosynthesis C-methylase UbiE
VKLHPDFADIAYDELSLWSSRFGALLFDNLELRRNVRGLDVACGAGFPLFELAFVHGSSSHFTGIDLWREALNRAQRKKVYYGLTNVDLCEADAAAMPFASESFDLITSNLGINNFADPEAVIAECHRVARTDARLVLTTNLTGHMAEFYELFRQTVPQDLIPALNAQEAHRGTSDGVQNLLRRHGFAISRVVEDEFFLKFADGTAMFRHHLVQFFLDGWRSVTDDPAIYAALEAKLNAASPLRMRIPMLYVEAVRR